MKLLLMLSLVLLTGCTTSQQPIGQTQVCIFASCNSSPVVDRNGNPIAENSELTEQVEQEFSPDQKGENSATGL